tara:strand:+ start:535 stop:1530 length:996 start_codon:yes stop_codon:yes gene_type:complete
MGSPLDSTPAKVTVHPSQFPGAVRRQLVASLRAGHLPPKFLYDSVRQTQKWLEVHQAHSPSRTDADVTRIYDAAFEDALGQAQDGVVALVGLGCGGGQKDTRCLAKLQPLITELHYVPCDVSQAMTLVARETAAELLTLGQVHPLVCDLAEAADFGQALSEILPAGAKRLFTFFGMIPNLEPDVILPKLRALLRAGDQLLFSANLAPGRDYRAGVERVLSQYDNAETRDWMLSFLTGIGVPETAGELVFGIEPVDELLRIVADFKFTQSQAIKLDGELVAFDVGQTLRLFFSYRHTVETLAKRLAKHGLQIVFSEIAESVEEGVFRVALLD